jgi:hypothetical protein
MIAGETPLFNPDNLQALTIWLLATGVIGLLISIYLRFRFGRIFALVLITISAPVLWPVCHAAFHRSEPSGDDSGDASAFAKPHPPEELVPIFCVLALIAALAIFAELRMRSAAIPLAIATVAPGIISIAFGIYLVLTY